MKIITTSTENPFNNPQTSTPDIKIANTMLSGLQSGSKEYFALCLRDKDPSTLRHKLRDSIIHEAIAVFYVDNKPTIMVHETLSNKTDKTLIFMLHSDGSLDDELCILDTQESFDVPVFCSRTAVNAKGFIFAAFSLSGCDDGYGLFYFLDGTSDDGTAAFSLMDKSRSPHTIRIFANIAKNLYSKALKEKAYDQ